MDIIIITTRDYHLYYNNIGQWRHFHCSKVLDFLKGIYENRNISTTNPVRNFYIKEENANSFWIRLKDFDVLFHEVEGARVYVMPCIPEYHIKGSVEGALKLSDEERQNYLGTIFMDVFNHLSKNNTDLGDFYLIVHDLDISTIGKDEKMRKEYLVSGSILEHLILEGKMSIENIYCFQHEPSKEMYKLLLQMLSGVFPDNLIRQINSIIKSSSELQAFLDDD